MAYDRRMVGGCTREISGGDNIESPFKTFSVLVSWQKTRIMISFQVLLNKKRKHLRACSFIY